MSNKPIYDQPLNTDPNYNQYYQGYNQGYGAGSSQPPQYPLPPQNVPYPPYQENPYQEVPAYPYQPQFQPPSQLPLPPSPPPPQTDIKYDYDTYNIQYQRIPVDSWQQIPPDPSPYSQMWASPQAFEPQTFSNNVKIEKKYNDTFWAVFFLINFVTTVAVIAWLGYEFKRNYNDQHRNSSGNGHHNNDTHKMLIAAAVGGGVGIVLNIIHYCYATFAPVVYIKAGIWIGVIVSVLCVIVPVSEGHYVAIVYPALMLLLTLILYCCMKKYIKLSAAVMKITTKIICRYPSIIVLVVLQSILEVAISVGFVCSFVFVEYNKVTRYIYIYLIFSFFWITLTFGYVTYMTCSGLAASWYFLNNTEYFPKSPVWESFKRATTTSFGSACLAGFLLAVVKTLESIVRSDQSSSGNGTVKLFLCLFRCIALCILKILEACISFINRYALIYCAIFGVPFKEGCRRWAELSCHRFCNVLLSGCCISNALTYNGLLFTLGGGALGYGISYLYFGNENHNEDFSYLIFALVFGILTTFAIFTVYSQPILTVSDTILICFSEAPEKLKTSANELYEILKEYYHENVDERIRSMNK